MHDLTIGDIAIQYESRLRDLNTAAAHARLHTGIAALMLAIASALFLGLGTYAIGRQIAAWWPAVPIPLAVASAQRYRNKRRSRYSAARLTQFYRRALDRIGGNWAGSGPTGEEFLDSDHPYARDLNVFGEGSLFELVCTARTAAGMKGLADYLLAAPQLDEIRSRQDAIQELRERIDLRERIALLGEFEAQESRLETFAEWLDAMPFHFSRTVQVAAMLTSAALVWLAVGGIAGLIAAPKLFLCASPLVAFHVTVGIIFRRRVNKMASQMQPVSAETQVLKAGLDLLATTPFQSAKLRRLAAATQGAAKSVRRLERLLNALNERNKELFYLPSLLLLLGTQLTMAIENWRREHGTSLRVWIEAWAEFEALNALANYAYENAENEFPVITEGAAHFDAAALGHPLLPHNSCVRNDVHLQGSCRFLILSGSNMSGKSTLLRTIGLNAVLAYAGAPVRAKSLRLSKVSICASLSVVDSLLNGKSKFLAEIERLRITLETSRETAVLFLIDEVLSGTNSTDRRIAAESIVRTLISRGAIGVFSTHDLALTEIAQLEELRGANVHMCSKSGGGPLDFDYILKPGITRESNAVAIAQMAGVPMPA